MSTSANKHFDAIERIIFEETVRIVSVAFNKALDLMSVTLNTGKELKFSISDFKRLGKAAESELSNYRLIGSGIGIHWPDLDEDLSLKGFTVQKVMESFGRSESWEERRSKLHKNLAESMVRA